MSNSWGYSARAFGFDLAATLLFVIVGRGTHQENPGLLGLLTAWWPFAAALAGAWLVVVILHRSVSVGQGVWVWIVTVAGGMLLRAASGQGTAVPFIIVATLALGLLLVGWRVVNALLRRRRTRAASAELRRTTERYP